jgi:BON domain
MGSGLRGAGVLAMGVLLLIPGGWAQERRNWYNDPFVQASTGYPQCPPASGPLLTQQEMRQQAHTRIERGTSCALEGKCEPGGAYKHDPQINERVRQAIASSRWLDNTSLWVTTQATYVTLEGCVHSAGQQRRLRALVEGQEGVRYVIDATTIGLPASDGSSKR